MRAVHFVSDLHLGAVPLPTGRSYSDAFGRFVDHLRGGGRLVLLGDTFDFLDARRRRGQPPDPSPAAAVATLDGIVEDHRAVVPALARFVAGGGQLDVVSGNHDAELVLPEVQDRLRDLIGSAVRFAPWLVQLDGLVHAEHGHQHHDVNVAPDLLGPRRGRPLRLPRASYLPAAGSSLRQRARAVATVMAASAAAPERAALDLEADRIGVSGDLLRGLDALVPRSKLGIVTRLVAKAAGRRAAADYLPVAAARVAEVRRQLGQGVRYLVFGHTHRAGTALLPDGALYLNCGTWTPFLPEGVEGPLLTAVRVDEQGASIVVWDDAASTLTPWSS